MCYFNSSIARLGNLAGHNLNLLTALIEYLTVVSPIRVVPVLEYLYLCERVWQIFGRA